MGFCLFNNVAVGAAQALAAHGLERVAIVDFDVHHGNGTQDIFWSDPRVLYASTHQWPLYPGTGARSETGAGNIVNAPLRIRQWLDRLPRRVRGDRAARPGALRAAAGADLGRVSMRTGSIHWRASSSTATTTHGSPHGWSALADRHAGGRIVSSLEGGYTSTALRDSTAAHVAALMA